MGPLARLIKSIFGKKKPAEEVKPIVDLRDEIEEAVKEADQGKFATQAEVDAVRVKWQSPVVEYTPPATAVAKPIVKDVPVKAAFPVAKPAPVVNHKSSTGTYHRNDDDYIDVSGVAAITAISSDFSDYSISESSSSRDCGSSPSNEYSGVSSSYDSGSSSSCDSSSL